MSQRKLETIQRWMQTVITHPMGISAGIQSETALQLIDITPEELQQVVTRSQSLDSLDRIAIYGNAYYARLLECLGEVFPVLNETLTEEVFNNFAYDYLQTYPSKSYTLENLGRNFANYLQESRPADEPGEEAPSWPDFMIDLARLEWAIGQIFDGPGVENDQLVSFERLKEMPPEQFAKVKLVPVVCLQLMEFQFPVSEFYTLTRREEEPAYPQPETTYLAISRRDYIVRRYPLCRAEYLILRQLQSGSPIADALQAAEEELTEYDDEQLSDQLQQWFSRWTSENFFAAIDLT